MQDPVFDLINKEKKRQSEGLELIPSENYVSANVLQAMGSILTNKYSEGYPILMASASAAVITQILKSGTKKKLPPRSYQIIDTMAAKST